MPNRWIYFGNFTSRIGLMDKIGVYPFSLDNFETIMLLNSIQLL